MCVYSRFKILHQLKKTKFKKQKIVDVPWTWFRQRFRPSIKDSMNVPRSVYFFFPSLLFWEWGVLVRHISSIFIFSKENFLWKHLRTLFLRHLTHRVYKSNHDRYQWFLPKTCFFLKSCTTLAVFNSVRYSIKIRRSTWIRSQIFVFKKKRTLSCKYDFGAFLRGYFVSGIAQLQKGIRIYPYNVSVPCRFPRGTV